jgi:drug/metabolite transporter (DMT)-like permease
METDALLHTKTGPVHPPSLGPTNMDDGVNDDRRRPEALEQRNPPFHHPCPTFFPFNVRILMGRVLLLLVAFFYGTLSVTIRFVYQLPGPPSASALCTARGWLATLCFLPFLWMNKGHYKDQQSRPQQPRSSSNTDGEGESDNQWVEDPGDPEITQTASQGGHEDTTNTSSVSSSSSSSSSLSPVEQPSQKQPHLWWIALELAGWNFGAQGLVALGLVSTKSARASFLTQTSVVMTPVVSAVAGKTVAPTVWIACVIAFLGLMFLSDASSSSSSSLEEGGEDDRDSIHNNKGGVGTDISIGDLIVLSGSMCWSLYIFRLSSVGDRYDEIELQAAKTFLLALLYSGWLSASMMIMSVAPSSDNEQLQPQQEVGIVEGMIDVIGADLTKQWPGWTSLAAWGLIFYSAIGPGTIADVMQQKGQAVIHASESNIVLSMEPVFTALLGQAILGEATTWQEKLGGGLIVGAAVIATQPAMTMDSLKLQVNKVLWHTTHLSHSLQRKAC